MKTSKTFRLSPVALTELQELQSQFPDYNMTEILEKAIDLLNAAEFCETAAPRALDTEYRYFVKKGVGPV